MIEITNATIGYGGDPVVRDVSLTLGEKAITAIIGPNGAGKSTLLGGIGRLLPLESGSVKVNGRALADWKSHELAQHIAILRQDNHVTVRLTVTELVALGRHPHSGGNLRDEDFRIIEDSLRCVNMLDFASRYLDELSGGQRQRAFIAMTLAQDSQYLLLDEPLSSLDMRHSRDMMRHLQQVIDERGISVAIVIHDINTAAAYASRLVALKAGRLVADGTPEEVMTPEVLGEIFEVKVNVTELGGRPVAFAQR